MAALRGLAFGGLVGVWFGEVRTHFEFLQVQWPPPPSDSTMPAPTISDHYNVIVQFQKNVNDF